MLVPDTLARMKGTCGYTWPKHRVAQLAARKSTRLPLAEQGWLTETSSFASKAT